MGITDALRNAVSTGNTRSIRIMMKDSLIVDPTFIEFNEMEKLTQNMSGLYDAHDGRGLNGDKSAWDDDYMNKLMVQVVGNFSHERLDHLKEVVRYLRPAAARPQQSASTDRTETGRVPPKRDGYYERRHQSEGNNNRGVKIAAGAAGGGVTGGVIAGIAGGSVIIGAVIGAVIVGAVVAVVTKGE